MQFNWWQSLVAAIIFMGIGFGIGWFTRSPEPIIPISTSNSVAGAPDTSYIVKLPPKIIKKKSSIVISPINTQLEDSLNSIVYDEPIGEDDIETKPWDEYQVYEKSLRDSTEQYILNIRTRTFIPVEEIVPLLEDVDMQIEYQLTMVNAISNKEEPAFYEKPEVTFIGGVAVGVAVVVGIYKLFKGK